MIYDLARPRVADFKRRVRALNLAGASMKTLRAQIDHTLASEVEQPMGGWTDDEIKALVGRSAHEPGMKPGDWLHRVLARYMGETKDHVRIAIRKGRQRNQSILKELMAKRVGKK